MDAKWFLAAPELLIAGTGLLSLILGLLLPRERRERTIGYLALAGIVAALGTVLWLWPQPGDLFDGIFRVDLYALFFKVIILGAAGLVLLGCFGYIDHVDICGEYYFMFMIATAGMLVLASAAEFITLFVGVEALTVSFVLLTAIRRTRKKNVEAALKYIILGSVAAAVFLYGLSFLYGLQGSTRIPALGACPGGWDPVLALAVVLVVGGLGFKVAAVPFHMWAPDVYEAAPAPVVGYLASGAKAACFAALARIMAPLFVACWAVPADLIALLAGVTMVAGNLMALRQTDIKRLLAYSSIGQAGYVLAGLTCPLEGGLKAVLFYLFLYLFAVVAAFTIVAFWKRISGSSAIKDYAGMARRAPLVAAIFLAVMLSMAGIPPLAGFVGKLYLFISVAQSHLWLAFIGFLMSVVSVYYYLRVALVMYRDEPADPAPARLAPGLWLALVAALGATLFIGIYPGPLSELCNGVVLSYLP